MRVWGLLGGIYRHCTQNVESTKNTAVSVAAFMVAAFSSARLGAIVATCYWLPTLYDRYWLKRGTQPFFPTDPTQGITLSILRVYGNVDKNPVAEADAKAIDDQRVKAVTLPELARFITDLSRNTKIAVTTIALKVGLTGKPS